MRLKKIVFLFLLAAPAYSAENQEALQPIPRPLGKEFTVFQPEQLNLDLPELEKQISLKQVRQLALLYNPEFRSLSWEIKAHYAELLQAGLLPNPELNLLAEDILGSTILVAKDFPQTTLQLSQPLLMGGKIELQQAHARLNIQLAGWDFEKKRMQLLAEVTALYIQVLEAQEYLTLTRELENIARETLDIIQIQVKKGRVSALEQNRAQVVLANTRLELEQAELNLDQSRENLADIWGGGGSDFESVQGRLEVHEWKFPPLGQLLERLNQHPDLARWKTEFQERNVQLRQAQAQAIPDLNLTGGLRHHHQSNDLGLLIGLSLPVPVFNQNQGNIQEAELRHLQAQESQDRHYFSLRADLKGAYQRLLRSQLTLKVLKREILPQAESTFLALRKAYAHGQFSYLEVLEAQRNFFETRRQGVSVLSDFYQALNQVEYLTAQELGGQIPSSERRLQAEKP